MERRQEVAAPLRRVSWGAIFVGAAISIAVMVLLALLGLAIGATITDPATGDSPSGSTMAVGAGVWWVLSGIVALMAGGWAAGRLAGLRRQMEGPLHGLAAWAVTTAALLFFMGSAIGAISSGALQVVSTGSRLVDRDAVTAGAMNAREGRGEATLSPSDRARDGAQAGLTEQEVRQAAQTAADGTAKAAWWAFLFLLLTAVAAGLGGLLGSRPRNPDHRSQTAARRAPLPAT